MGVLAATRRGQADHERAQCRRPPALGSFCHDDIEYFTCPRDTCWSPRTNAANSGCGADVRQRRIGDDPALRQVGEGADVMR